MDSQSFAGVSPSGTYYERWLNIDTGAVTDSVSAYAEGTPITPAVNRAYTNIKIAAGIKLLAEMRAM